MKKIEFREGGLPTSSTVQLGLALLAAAVILAVVNTISGAGANPFSGCSRIMGELANIAPGGIETC